MIKSYIESNQRDLINEDEEKEESLPKTEEKIENITKETPVKKRNISSDTVENTKTLKFMLDEKFDYGRFRREMIEQIYAKKLKLELFPDLDDSNFVNCKLI